MEKKNNTQAVAENKAVETKVSFDKKAFYQQMAKAFTKSKVVDVVADTDRLESLDRTEYEYVHFYKKGTEKNLFQCYVKKENVQFVVGVRLKDFLKQGKNYTITPVEKTRNGEKKMVYIRVTCNHEDAAAVAETIIEAYESRTIKEVEPAAKTETKKDTKVKETKKSEKKDA